MISATLALVLAEGLLIGMVPDLPLRATTVSTSPWIMTQAQPLTAEQALERIFQAEAVEADWFAQSFLEQVPFQQIQPLLTDLKQSLGAFQGIQARDGGYAVMFERGTVPAQIALDDQGRIAQLLIGRPEAPLSLAEATALIQAFPREASLLVLEGDRVLAAVNADQPLAVGSAFKLAVLAALQDAITTGSHQWTDVVVLEAAWRSLPSGLLQDWPPGTALTLETLATLMISLSDNTATDALIHLLGREAVETWSPRNQPFLTTRDFFVLKNPANADYLAQFREGNEAERRSLLSTLTAVPLPPVTIFGDTPLALDVEWFFSARELCELMATVQDLPLMQVNPGLARPQDWQSVAFKGGSEPGVLNLTTADRKSVV